MITCLVGNSKINCFDEKYDKHKLKKWSYENRLICPDCGKYYEYCHGEVVSPYFRHKEKSIECDEIYHEPETQEHIQGKTDLYKWLLSIKDEYMLENIHLEYYIKETRQKPDIYFEQNGKRYVIEYQCTPISSEYLKRRELYKLAGINDIWILGTLKYTGTKHIEKYTDLYYDSFNKYLKIKDTKVEKYDIKVIGTDKFLLECFCVNDGCIVFTDKYKKSMMGRFSDKIKIIDNNMMLYKNRQLVFSKLESILLKKIKLKSKQISLYNNLLSNKYGCLEIHFKILNTKNTMRLIAIDYDKVTIYEKHSKIRVTKAWSNKKHRYVETNQREYFYVYNNPKTFNIDYFNYNDVSRIILNELKDILDKYK